jgi:hypothetical protein
MTIPVYVANELFKRYKDINEKVKNINKGGCGVFAEHLYKTLRKLGAYPELAVITNSVQGMGQRIKVWKEHGKDKWELYRKYAIVDHIVVIVGDVLVDSEGLYLKLSDHPDRSYHGQKLYKKLDINTLEKWNSVGTFWNDDFDRDNERLIEAKLEACYKKVKKSLVVSK